MHRWSDYELAKANAEDPGHPILIQLIKTVRDDVQMHYEDKIDSIISEFGDNPDECLILIDSYIQQSRHYRLYPNAERTD